MIIFKIRYTRSPSMKTLPVKTPIDPIIVRQEISRFVKNFLDVDISPEPCFPTVGSMQGCYMAMMCTTRRCKGKNKILFLDPGFPVNKLQASVVGAPFDHFDVYEYRR